MLKLTLTIFAVPNLTHTRETQLIGILNMLLRRSVDAMIHCDKTIFCGSNVFTFIILLGLKISRTKNL